MAGNDLVFKTLDSQTIYDPLKLTADVTTTITVRNYGTEDLTGLGLYIVPSTNLGPVDYPADFPPETDYQDLMTWGQAVDAGLALVGGLKVYVPTNAGNQTHYITREKGSLKTNKIDFIDLAAGASAQFTVTLQTPPAVAARRMFVDVVIE